MSGLERIEGCEDRAIEMFNESGQPGVVSFQRAHDVTGNSRGWSMETVSGLEAFKKALEDKSLCMVDFSAPSAETRNRVSLVL